MRVEKSQQVGVVRVSAGFPLSGGLINPVTLRHVLDLTRTVDPSTSISAAPTDTLRWSHGLAWAG